MKLIAATGLRWENPEETAVYMMATFEVPAILSGPKGRVVVEAKTIGPVAFSASAFDETDHGREAFADALAGKFGSIAPMAGPTLDQAKTDKSTEMRRACQSAIIGGFSSSALGAPHLYPSNATDQTNLIGSVVAAMVPGLAADWTTPFWCADAVGAWEFRPHTAAQIIQAGVDAKAHVVACQMKLASIMAEIEAASTVPDVVGVEWE